MVLSNNEHIMLVLTLQYSIIEVYFQIRFTIKPKVIAYYSLFTQDFGRHGAPKYLVCKHYDYDIKSISYDLNGQFQTLQRLN